MRPIIAFETNTPTITKTMLSPPAIPQPRSPWHSPVPYLFGGLAAMLGLIAFALLILACSYWRLSGRLDNGEGGEGRDIDSGIEKEGKTEKVYEEKYLVIMAGNNKPTFLATPASSRASSFGDKKAKVENKEGAKMENVEKVKQEVDNHGETTTTTAAEAEEEEEEENESPETQERQQVQEQNQ